MSQAVPLSFRMRGLGPEFQVCRISASSRAETLSQTAAPTQHHLCSRPWYSLRGVCSRAPAVDHRCAVSHSRPAHPHAQGRCSPPPPALRTSVGLLQTMAVVLKHQPWPRSTAPTSRATGTCWQACSASCSGRWAALPSPALSGAGPTFGGFGLRAPSCLFSFLQVKDMCSVHPKIGITCSTDLSLSDGD